MTHVSDHAVRIYAERKLGIYADVDGDPQFLVYLTSINIDVEILRRKLSIYGDLGSRFGAPAVIAEGIKVIIKDHTVVTVLAKGMTVGGCSGPPQTYWKLECFQCLSSPRSISTTATSRKRSGAGRTSRRKSLRAKALAN